MVANIAAQLWFGEGTLPFILSRHQKIMARMFRKLRRRRVCLRRRGRPCKSCSPPPFEHPSGEIHPPPRRSTAPSQRMNSQREEGRNGNRGQRRALKQSKQMRRQALFFFSSLISSGGVPDGKPSSVTDEHLRLMDLTQLVVITRKSNQFSSPFVN